MEKIYKLLFVRRRLILIILTLFISLLGISKVYANYGETYSAQTTDGHTVTGWIIVNTPSGDFNEEYQAEDNAVQEMEKEISQSSYSTFVSNAQKAKNGGESFTVGQGEHASHYNRYDAGFNGYEQDSHCVNGWSSSTTVVLDTPIDQPTTTPHAPTYNVPYTPAPPPPTTTTHAPTPHSTSTNCYQCNSSTGECTLHIVSSHSCPSGEYQNQNTCKANCHIPSSPKNFIEVTP